MKARVTIFLFTLFLSSAVVADCEYNNAKHPEGTEIGPYVCVDNQWIHAEYTSER
ncbi:hypothetical protein ACFL2V_08770 [Pseudomonadota bacterium]